MMLTTMSMAIDTAGLESMMQPMPMLAASTFSMQQMRFSTQPFTIVLLQEMEWQMETEIEADRCWMQDSDSKRNSGSRAKCRTRSDRKG